jgi:hypothetical protein
VPLAVLVEGRGRVTVPWGEVLRTKYRFALTEPGPEVSGLTASILVDLLRAAEMPHDA